MIGNGESEDPQFIPRVIAISSDDRWAHVYENVPAARSEKAFAGQDHAALDFFEPDGRRLRASFSAAGALETLEPADDVVDPALLCARLHRVLALVTPVVRQRRADLSGYLTGYLTEQGVTLEQALGKLPGYGGADVEETLRRFQSVLGPHPMDDDKEHRGSVWHNVFVHGF